MSERPGSIYFDEDGVLTEHRSSNGQEVVVRYDDVPESDVTIVGGIPCTTALRTVIDLAPELESGHLRRTVRDCLDRGLFTVDEALARVAQPDMQHRLGAVLLRITLLFVR